jgi:enoyl-CoA hydratase/3-hydroxyacyl-CoA dehydrogenase
MSDRTTKTLSKLAVIGAGTMGAGIAQKMATEGFDVVLVDVDEEKVDRGIETVRSTLAEGVKRRIFKPKQSEEILARIRGSHDWSALADVDLVVEAVFEDLATKRDVFRRLEGVCRPDAILATNTSSFSVGEVAKVLERPERVVGLHYFYHPAKNRLVEVIPAKCTAPGVRDEAWAVQERMGKTPIHSADASGFVVNRFFVAWLNAAVRLLKEGIADIPTIEAACKESFGVGMGPFELMNVTGVPIALRAATTLGRSFGPFHAPSVRLQEQVDTGEPWPLEGQADASRFKAIEERMLGCVFYAAARLVDEGVGSIEDTDIGARVGLRWPLGPFELINRHGLDKALDFVKEIIARWELPVPQTLILQAALGKPFEFRLIHSAKRDGIATLTVNRPDAMNALNEAVVAQLSEAFKEAASDPEIKAIVIGGAGKAFIAGADIRFFVRNIESKTLDRIVEFTRAGHALLDIIDRCPKPVVARVDGLALGGGLELALACDRIVATPKASLAFPETGIGIYPGLGGTQRTSRRVGVGMAKALIFTGRVLGAEEARRIGLIDKVVTHDRLDKTIHELIENGTTTTESHKLKGNEAALARFFETHSVEDVRTGRVDARGSKSLVQAMEQVGRKAPLALRMAERLIDEGADRPLREGLRMELEHVVEIFRTDDAYEGLSSLGRKRPEFKGH